MPSSLLPVSARPETTMLPSDPAIPLTAEQTAAFWGGDIHAGLRRMVSAVQQKHMTQQPHQTSTVPAPRGELQPQ